MAAASYRAWGLVFALGGVVGFSFRPILVKLCYAAYPASPVTLLFLRMSLSLPVFMLVAWLLSRQDAGRLISFLYPTIVVLLSLLFLRKRPAPREIAALFITYAGIALVVSDQVAGTPNDRLFVFGVLLCFANALSYAVYLVAGAELTKRIGSMRFTAYTMIAATVPAVVQFLAIEPVSALNLPATVWGYVLLMVMFATIVPVFLAAEALRRIGANQFALIGGVSPVVTVFAAAFGLEEPVTILQVAGSVLVISGVLLVSLKQTS